jgi:hypothetical protein
VTQPLGFNPANTYTFNIPGIVFSLFHEASEDVNTGAACSATLGGNKIFDYDYGTLAPPYCYSTLCLHTNPLLTGWYTNTMTASFAAGCGEGDTVSVSDAGGAIQRDQNFRALVVLGHC